MKCAVITLLLAGSSLVAFDNPQVHQLLAERCVSCHGPDKIKGGLRVDTMEEIWRGGDGGAVLVPGQPLQSSLYTLCALDPEDPDRMPGKGRALTTEQLQLLHNWIEQMPPPAEAMMSGGMNDNMDGHAHGQPAGTNRVAMSFDDPWSALTKDLPVLDAQLLTAGRDRGLIVDELAPGLISVAAGMRGAAWTDEDTTWLYSVAPHVVSLDWQRSELQRLPSLSPLTRLRHLQVRGNNLLELPMNINGVQVLNISDNPELGDRALIVLATWQGLRRVHVHGTAGNLCFRMFKSFYGHLSNSSRRVELALDLGAKNTLCNASRYSCAFERDQEGLGSLTRIDLLKAD